MLNPTPRTLRLHADDDVVVAVDSIPEGARVGGVTAAQRVPKGHKLAVRPLAQGQPLKKFGQIIGFASKAIQPGEWVHEHNLGFAAFERDYDFCADARVEPRVSGPDIVTFEGFRRANGKVGTRNYIGILTSVNCSASVARFMAEAVEKSGCWRISPMSMA